MDLTLILIVALICDALVRIATSGNYNYKVSDLESRIKSLEDKIEINSDEIIEIMKKHNDDRGI